MSSACAVTPFGLMFSCKTVIVGPKKASEDFQVSFTCYYKYVHIGGGDSCGFPFMRKQIVACILFPFYTEHIKTNTLIVTQSVFLLRLKFYFLCLELKQSFGAGHFPEV